MKFINLRYLIIGIAMLAAAGLAVAITPREKVADHSQKFDLQTAIPKSFGDWKVDESVIPIMPSPDVKANLDQTYDQMVNRTYVNSKGQRMMMSIAYGSVQNQKLRAHRQEVCYSAQGFKIEKLRKETISILGRQVSATHMFATQGPRSEPVTYWFTMGDQVVLSFLDRQLVQLKYSLSGYIPDGFLVRFSSIATDPESAYPSQIAFANELMRSMDIKMAEKLVGKAG